MKSALVVSTLAGSLACGNLVGDAELPAGTQGPNTYNTPAGAFGLYRGAKQQLHVMIAETIKDAGALTDELTAVGLGGTKFSIGGRGNPTDERLLPEDLNGIEDQNASVYRALQEVRGITQQSIGIFRTYAPDTTPDVVGELYAMQGYAELLLAELYCSGVPLSTLDFQQDFTYKPSSTQTEVAQHAVVLLDSALRFAHDSLPVVWFAQVAKGRALLDLGQYAQAAQAVATVPDTFRYRTAVVWGSQAWIAVDGSSNLAGFVVANQEGENGLPFVTSNDPRVPVTLVGTNAFDVDLFAPAAYPAGTTAPIVLASGVEARLIEAEAALRTHPNDPRWLVILNTLRTMCLDAATCSTPAPAGTGGVAGLPPLSDPGSDTARVSLLFTERGYWLFLTAHRQGDLRRLVRPVNAGGYGRPQNTVYPTGPYFGGQGAYGSDITLPIPGSERPNPFFHGCIDRKA